MLPQPLPQLAGICGICICIGVCGVSGRFIDTHLVAPSSDPLRSSCSLHWPSTPFAKWRSCVASDTRGDAAQLDAFSSSGSRLEAGTWRMWCANNASKWGPSIRAPGDGWVSRWESFSYREVRS
ncbi:hypothetical protein KR009_000513 [Drosophila setifemur]|nr:hypothetical protein KR009_000513 [Drosophila setifemur]